VISLVNNAAKILFGYDENELVGSKVELLLPNRFKSHHPTSRKNFFDKPQTRAMGSGRDLYAIRKDGQEIPVEIGLNPIETEEGILVLASIIDISQRKVQEETIKKQSALEIKNRELEQFAYIASHDLQEPLRTVSNYAQLLEDDYKDLLDKDALKYIFTIQRATNRMRLLVKGLLDFSRVGRDKKLTLINCKQIVADTLVDLSTSIQESNATVNVGELPELYAYETEIRQLFQNIISNALKFQNKFVAPVIQIKSERLADKWKFSITDNGIGIAAKDFDRIFQIFQRLNKQSHYEGYGMGLPYCKKITELHGGEIWVSSKQGEWSTFNFTISNLK
jgi:PAS domain S-box-containing protein